MAEKKKKYQVSPSQIITSTKSEADKAANEAGRFKAAKEFKPEEKGYNVFGENVTKEQFEALRGRTESGKGGGKLDPKSEKIFNEKREFFAKPLNEQEQENILSKQYPEFSPGIEEELSIIAPETQEGVISQAKEPIEGDRSVLDVAKDIAFGNYLEKNPITGEIRTDPATGQPIDVQAGTAPLTPAPDIQSAASAASAVKTAGMTSRILGHVKHLDKIFTTGKGALIAIGGLGAGIWGAAQIIDSFDPSLASEVDSAVSEITQDFSDIEGSQFSQSEKLKQLDAAQERLAFWEQKLYEKSLTNSALRTSKEILEIQETLLTAQKEAIRVKQNVLVEGAIEKNPRLNEDVIREFFETATTKELEQFQREYDKRRKKVEESGFFSRPFLNLK